jgi:hypothetical protein
LISLVNKNIFHFIKGYYGKIRPHIYLFNKLEIVAIWLKK